MTELDLRQKFLGMVDGSLAEEERQRCLAQLEHYPELKAEFVEYSAAFHDAQHIGKNSPSLDGAFAAEVMEEIERRTMPAAWSWAKFIALSQRITVPMAAVAGVLVMVLVGSAYQKDFWRSSPSVAVPASNAPRAAQIPVPPAPVVVGRAKSVMDFEASEINYNDERISNSIDVTFGYIEGTFGAIAMIGFGIAALLCAVTRHYRFAFFFLSLTVLVFLLRSLIWIVFNTESVTGF